MYKKSPKMDKAKICDEKRDTGGIARDEEKLYFRVDQTLMHSYASPQTILFFFANISQFKTYQT
jgi:hypothetical protein